MWTELGKVAVHVALSQAHAAKTEEAPSPARPAPTFGAFAVLTLLLSSCCIVSNGCVGLGALVELFDPPGTAHDSDPAEALVSAFVCVAPALVAFGLALVDLRRTRRWKELVRLAGAGEKLTSVFVSRRLGISEEAAAALVEEAHRRGFLAPCPRKDPSPFFTTTAASPTPPTQPIPPTAPQPHGPFPRPALPANPPPPESWPVPPAPPPSPQPAPTSGRRFVGRCDFCAREVIQDTPPAHRQKCPDCRAPLRFESR